MNSRSSIWRLFTLFSLLSCICVGVNAQNILWVDSLSSGPRQQAVFLININNADSIVAVQCDVVFPAGLSYVSNSVHLSARASAHTLSASMISSTTLRILVYSFNGVALDGKSGPVVSFACQAGIQSGTFSIHVANVVLSSPKNTNVLTQAYDGQFIILAPSIKTNADSINFGSIPLGQSSNVAITINNVGNMPLNLLGISSTLAEIIATDSSSVTINANSSITRTLRFQPVKKGTKTGLIMLKSNDPQDSIKVINVRGTAYAVNEIHVGTATARSGYQTKLRLSVNNMEPFTAFQCVLHLPSVMKYVVGSAVLLTRKVDHQVSADTIGNSLKLVCFSPSNSTFQGNGGDVVELTFLITGQGGSYMLPVDSGILADSTGMNIMSASYNGSLQIAAPKLQLTSQLLNFGSLSSVSQSSQLFSIQNIGSDTLNITSMAVVGDGFTFDQSLPLVLAVNQSRSVHVLFSSAKEGTHAGSITIRSNDATNDPTFVSLSGSIFIPNVLLVEQDSIYENRFGSIRIGLWNLKPVTAVQFDLTIPSGLVPSIDSLRKTSRATNHILQASSLGSNRYRFILYSPTSAILKDSIGDILELPIYTSSSPGSYSIQFQNVSISDTSGHNISTGQQNGTIKVVNIALPFLSEGFIDFGNIRKSDSLAHQVTFYNKNLTYIILKPISVSASQGFNLIQSNDSTVMQPGDSVSFWFKFKPTSFGTFTDTVKVISDGGTVKVAVSGSSPYPILTNLKTSIAYGNVAKNTTKTDTVKVVNSSINTLTVDSIYTKTSAFVVDRISGTVGTDTLKVAVSFTPSAIASYVDTVYLRNNSTTPLVKISLSGNCPAPTILCIPRTILFGDVGIYDSSKTILKVANTSVNTLFIDSIYSHSTVFTSSLASSQVTNKDSATITVRFKPVKFGVFLDTLFLRNNSDSTVFAIPLSGISPASSIFITPSSIAFGNVRKDSTHQLLFAITDSSVSPVQIDSLWTKTKFFNVTHILAVYRVRKGDTTKVSIRFTPDSVRSYVDTMFIANNSPISPYKVPLSGNGTITGVEQTETEIPTVFSLAQNYPNPFNPSTTLQYGIPLISRMRLQIYNVLGQVVANLVDGEQVAGWYKVRWNANVSTGIYFYRIDAVSTTDPTKHFVDTKKMLLLR